MYRCRTCRHEETAWARIERHVDTEHGAGRIEIILEDKREEAKPQGVAQRGRGATPPPRSSRT